MTIQQVDVEIIRPLRSLVLRPGQPIESTDYDRDNGIFKHFIMLILSIKKSVLLPLLP